MTNASGREVENGGYLLCIDKYLTTSVGFKKGLSSFTSPRLSSSSSPRLNQSTVLYKKQNYKSALST